MDCCTLVGEPELHRIFGGALAICAPAVTGDGRQHGGPAVFGSNLVVDCLRFADLAMRRIKSAISHRVLPKYCADFYRDWYAAGALVRVRGRPQNRRAGQTAFVAQSWQSDVWAAVGVRRGNFLEMDRTTAAARMKKLPLAELPKIRSDCVF